MSLLANATSAHARGWALTPLRGKVPILGAWQRTNPPTVEQIREWIAAGNNLGIRTGEPSGVLLLDRDTAKGAEPLELPPTVRAITPGGGEHHYFQDPGGLGNSASKLAPYWDTRGTGGQAVYPGSRHPNGGIYKWAPGCSPEDLPLAPLPEWVHAKLRTVVIPPASVARENAYAKTALVKESAAVRNAPEGSRNETLNKAAFSLGQLVAGGELSESEVRECLESDAILAGLPLAEVSKTISSGLAAGGQQPRTKPNSTTTVAVHRPPNDDGTDIVLIPGSHALPGGEYVEVSAADFSDAAYLAMPRDLIYRRGGIPGEITDGAFRELDKHRTRLLVSRHVRFGAGLPPKKDDSDPSIVFRALSADHGALIQAGAVTDPGVRPLDLLTPHPVILPDWSISPPGWSQGVYYSGPPAPEPIRDHATIRATLEDLVTDFPFASEADRQNFYGLLLTPLICYAIGGPAPLHTIYSGMERTGKTKLAETVFGGIVMGRATPVFQLGRHEEEREKRLFAILLSGESVLLLDNLAERLDSPALASLLTANVYRGRTLGRSHVAALPNHLTIIATGNNVEASSEIAKRIVPIGLETPPNPESRTDFKHPDLAGYVATQRPQVLACMLGMIANWRKEGAQDGPVPFGGFEGWSKTVGGVLAAHGLTEWLSNAQEWRGEADEFSAEVDAFVEEWAARGGLTYTASEAFDLAVALGLFETCTKQSDQGKGRLMFTHRVLTRLPDRPVGGWRIRRSKSRGRSRYNLEPLPKQGQDHEHEANGE